MKFRSNKIENEKARNERQKSQRLGIVINESVVLINNLPSYKYIMVILYSGESKIKSCACVGLVADLGQFGEEGGKKKERKEHSSSMESILKKHAELT